MAIHVRDRTVNLQPKNLLQHGDYIFIDLGDRDTVHLRAVEDGFYWRFIDLDNMEVLVGLEYDGEFTLDHAMDRLKSYNNTGPHALWNDDTPISFRFFRNEDIDLFLKIKEADAECQE